MAKVSLQSLEKNFVRAPASEQRIFLMHLPALLDLSPEDVTLLKAAETSFTFWNNSEDAIYDAL